MEKKQEQPMKIEGQEAVDALFEALDKDGILIKPEQNDIGDLQKRVRELEQEVDLLKDLMARALDIKNERLLKG